MEKRSKPALQALKANAFAGGEGFSPQQAQRGYQVAAGIIMRPVLLTFGFIFAFLLIQVGGGFLGLVLDVFTHGLIGNSVGPIAFVTLIGVFEGIIISTVYFILKLITHLGQHVPSWIQAFAGVDLGVDSSAASARQEGQGHATQMTRGALGYTAGRLSAPPPEDVPGGGKGGDGGGPGSGGGDTASADNQDYGEATGRANKRPTSEV